MSDILWQYLSHTISFCVQLSTTLHSQPRAHLELCITLHSPWVMSSGPLMHVLSSVDHGPNAGYSSSSSIRPSTSKRMSIDALIVTPPRLRGNNVLLFVLIIQHFSPLTQTRGGAILVIHIDQDTSHTIPLATDTFRS